MTQEPRTQLNQFSFLFVVSQRHSNNKQTWDRRLLNVHYCLHLLAFVATVCLMLSGEATPLIFLLMSAGSLQPQPRARSAANVGVFRVPADGSLRQFQSKPGSFFPKGDARAASICIRPSTGSFVLQPSALQFSLSARGRAGDFISVWKLESVQQLCILIYGSSLRSHHILRGVSWLRSSNSHLELDPHALTLKYQITVFTCKADLTFKGAISY